MKTSLQCVTMPADKRPMFVCRDASGIVTFRNPERVYPRLFKVAPIWFFEPERYSSTKQKKVF